MKEHSFPKFDYYLDESDSDIVILRRQDGSFVAPFSASGATREGIDEAAREDYWELIQAHTNVLSRKSQERLSS
jgi:3-oxoacyl-ACP reductase-like protein